MTRRPCCTPQHGPSITTRNLRPRADTPHRRHPVATDANIAIAVELMTRFAQRTGLESDAPSQRYLWTDAFAACNFLGLADARSDPRFRQQALLMVERVHGELGQFRQDDVRCGWLDGP